MVLVTVGWTQKFGKEGGGADHLGMRVAGEAAYADLLDFTTTQTWRPRYFSFYCWLLRRAFLASGGDETRSEYELDLATWYEVVKQGDYVFAAASLLADPEAKQVAGSDTVTTRISHDPLVPMSNHLKSKRGGFDIYAGPMRKLGLVERASLRAGKLFDRPFGKGRALAKAFEVSLGEGKLASLLDNGAIDRADLKSFGQLCGLTVLQEASEHSRAVQNERELLRSCIVDWDRAQESDVVMQRILSIGLILRLHKLHSDERPGLLEFREFTLLNTCSAGTKRKAVKLSEVYAQIIPSWAMYQAHAFATYALEWLLYGVTAIAEEQLEKSPAGVSMSGVLLETAKCIEAGDTFRGEWLREDWCECTFSELQSSLCETVEQGAKAKTLEPELFYALWTTVDRELWTGDALLLFVLSVERLRHLTTLYGEDAWPGSTDSSRLPPAALISRLDSFDGSLSVSVLVPELLLDLVVRQHRRTALRKLAANTTPDTSLFQLEGPLLTDFVAFNPGTSNPRFGNAVQYLEDLGYLPAHGAAGLTDDGEKLLKRIEEGSE